MAEKKKASSIDDVLNSGASAITTYYQQFANDDFKKRVEKHDEFFKNNVGTVLDNEAYDMHHGIQSPGAIQDSYKTLDSIAKKEQDVINSEDKIKEILESYMTGFFRRANRKDVLDTAEKMKQKGESKDAIRTFLSNHFSAYHLNQNGRGIDIMSPDQVKEFVGRSKADIKKGLREMANQLHGAHTTYLQNNAFQGYWKLERDHIPLAEHLHEKASALNLRHPAHQKTLYTREFPDLIGDLGGLHQDQMGARGYRHIKAGDQKYTK